MKKENQKPLIKLKLKRIEKGFTQEELAKKIGVFRMTIYYYESGKRKPNSDMLVKLSDALGCKVDEII